jgi:hypothetical protein
MKRAQKLVLILFAFVDVAVIGALAVIVIRNGRQQGPETPPVAAPPSACVASVLDAFSTDGSSARVDWNDTGSDPPYAMLDIVLAGETLPEAPTAQLLWTVLDRLSPSLPELCELPPLLTFRVTVVEGTETHHYVVETSGEALGGWLRGDLDDTELALHARFRTSVAAAP